MEQTTRIAITGHLFVCRQNHFVRRRCSMAHDRVVSPTFQNFWLENVDISFHGVPGCTIARYYQTILPILRHSNPHIVYLDLAHNDICLRNQSPDQVAHDLVSLAWTIACIPSVRVVIVAEPLWRLKSPNYLPDFHDRLRVFRTILRPIIDSTPSVTRWYHSRLWQKNKDYFAADSLHLSDYGNLYYYKSIRGALIPHLPAQALATVSDYFQLHFVVRISASIWRFCFLLTVSELFGGLDPYVIIFEPLQSQFPFVNGL